MTAPELLSPAGSPEALRAAVQCGAGAVYLGWGNFNARRSAKNFSDEEFADALVYCHARGVRVFLTLNTLLTDRELPQALETARTACRLGVDAILVQDWGLFDLLRQTLPDLPLHASTQMSIFTSGGAVEMANEGCERVVIARECSKEETAAICRNCPVEVEAFVHGALCMCYSGQCAMSALIGGRSGNRGRCAQPCRMIYGVNAPAKNAHPLSLKDNCLAHEVPAMAQMGLSCLKLEGRMKRPEYVAVITGIYARLLEENRSATAEERRQLEQAFSRSGFTDLYWQGRHGSEMFGMRPENAAEPKELFDAARSAYEKDNLRLVDITMHCVIRPGEAAALTVSDGDGHSLTVTGAVPEAALRRAITAREVTDRLRKTGGTAYRAAEVTAEVAEGLSLSAGAVNALRRDALAALEQARTAPPVRRELPVPPEIENACAAENPRFTVSLSTLAQLSPELLCGDVARILLPLEQVEQMDALPEFAGEWCVVLPRVWKDSDEEELLHLLRRAESLGFTGAYVGNMGHLSILRRTGLSLYGDFGMNVFNSRSLAYLGAKGLRSACLSFELRFAQLRDLAKAIPAEAIVYGRLPLMITENCLVQNSCGCRPGFDNVLRDRTGAAFPLLCAYGHRTEIENSRSVWLADRPEWKRLGLTFARLRFTTESAGECAAVLRAYREGAAPQGEFTRGLYERGVE